MRYTQFIQFCLGDEFEIVVHDFLSFLFQFLSELVKDTTPLWSGSETWDVVSLYLWIFICNEKHSSIRNDAEVVEVEIRLYCSEQIALQFSCFDNLRNLNLEATTFEFIKIKLYTHIVFIPDFYDRTIH